MNVLERQNQPARKSEAPLVAPSVLVSELRFTSASPDVSGKREVVVGGVRVGWRGVMGGGS